MTRAILSLRIASGALAAFLLVGCTSLPSQGDGARRGPFFTPTNVHGDTRLPEHVRRIAVLPSAGDGTLEETSLTVMDQAFGTELNQTGRAEIVPLSRDQIGLFTQGRRQLVSTDALPFGLLEKVRKVTAADALLFTDITSYSPYPPLRIGVRMKLVDLSTGNLIWAFDTVFDASAPAVANSARRHFLDRNPSVAPGDLSYTVLQNPSRFASYVGAAAFSTLPSR